MSDALERLKNRQRPVVQSRDIQISSSQDTFAPEILDIQTKQTTLRLEQGVSDRLQSKCQSARICREVFIEAMFEYVEKNSDALDDVMKQAIAKNELRQKIANKKRAKAMIDKFG